MRQIGANVLYSLEAELATLGAMMFGRKAVNMVSAIVKPEDFFYPQHRTIFEAMCRLRSKNVSIDHVTLLAELNRIGALDEIGGNAYLMRIMEDTPSAANADHYAEVVRDFAVLRGIDEFGRYCESLARREGMDAREKVADMLTSFQRLRTGGKAGFSIRDLDLTKQKVSYKSILEPINAKSASGRGLVRGGVHVYAATEGTGKSIISLYEARNLWEQGYSGAVYTLGDLSEVDLGKRLIRQVSGYEDQPEGGEALERWEEARQALSDMFSDSEITIFTGKDHGYTIEEIELNLRDLASRKRLDWVVIDYVQIVEPPRSHQRDLYAGQKEIWKRLTRLAETLDIVLIVASQLTESVTGRKYTMGGQDGNQHGCVVLFFSDFKEVGGGIRDSWLEVNVHKLRFGRSRWKFGMEMDYRLLVPKSFGAAA